MVTVLWRARLYVTPQSKRGAIGIWDPPDIYVQTHEGFFLSKVFCGLQLGRFQIGFWVVARTVVTLPIIG